MITFAVCLILLVGGYFVYGKFVDRIFGPDDRKTPAEASRDGVDYVPLPTWKIFLIQFLNIAGLGPIFGAVLGAMYGPVVFLWITFGTIFIGAVHDYFSGMISERHNGTSLPDLIGIYLGRPVKILMRVLIVILMVMVGTVFVNGPSNILAGLTDNAFGGLMDLNFWIVVIFIYFLVACIFPIDKIIGNLYPIFGFALLFMAVALFFMLIFNAGDMPELRGDTFRNMHPNASKMHLFPMMFITVACGAVSGFHATQSPMMARCIRKETEGRKIFYGAMVAEGIVALIWAAAAMTFFGSIGSFQESVLAVGNNASVIVDKIAHGWLGKFGAVLALLGVVAAPITSADTAFRSCRLIIAEALNISQKSFWNRVWLSLPLFAVSVILLQINFDIIWRYFAFTNQTLAAFTLWAVTVYLYRRHKPWIITLIPAIFMTVVCSTYILCAPEGLRLPLQTSVGIGLAFAACCTGLFFWLRHKENKTTNQYSTL
ncbi:MAG: carbon starvation protein A [Bacteroidales bacterium]|nr:carbon starvation protein A [Bacteroidales bacterium]